MKTKLFAVVGVLFVAMLAHAQIQTAGDLLLNVDVSSLSALQDGAKLNSWANSGTLGEVLPLQSAARELFTRPMWMARLLLPLTALPIL